MLVWLGPGCFIYLQVNRCASIWNNAMVILFTYCLQLNVFSTQVVMVDFITQKTKNETVGKLLKRLRNLM